ncbi:3-deoxy-D-manno-octulosonic acid transferase [Maribacter stanieri]|uniref:3-deoxy-D-manno-octulosonic acid transferase n=1 Tax=Maribacter stanieri TaxID=440514 RepID=UPI0024952D74|nr:glycosyltransferase N-terminal domain-containing protein [Maribacter stanieri]
MYFLYNLIVISASAILKVLALVNPKLSLFVNGRKETLNLIKDTISKTDKVIWIHAASLGEYEQGLPVMEKLKLLYPNHKFLLTFFSPSGYEVKKNSKVADVICYLPLDTKKNVHKFLEAAHPDLAIFIKYEIWPNYLAALNSVNTPTFLISALFKNNQNFFKWHGSFMRKALTNFSHFFVQNEKSKELLNSIDFKNVTVAGDTRFDRVTEILDRNNSLEFMAHFKQNQFCFVLGSTWPEDEKLIVEYINNSSLPIKFVIAPHTIKNKHVEEIIEAIKKPVARFSELENIAIEDYEVLIIDTIGILTKIYSYADLAYVGGGFVTGLHNTLEPAVFGIPVIIGPNFNGFAEAEELVQLGGVNSIKDLSQFNSLVNTYSENNEYRLKIGQINANYIQEKAGATKRIVNELKSVFPIKN